MGFDHVLTQMILSHDQEPDNWKMAEKGYSILRHIEKILGEEKILIFLKGGFKMSE